MATLPTAKDSSGRSSNILGWRRLAELWASHTGIDWLTYRLIFKDCIAPTIGLAANQATPWSNIFGTLGFLVPMVSIISHPSPPRAEFLWILITNILGICVSAAITALATVCVIKARQQSEGPIVESAKAPYNAVASTVAAIWLIVQTYVISAIRYNYPWTVWVASACLIFSNYGMLYVVQFGNMEAAFRFLRQLLWAHLVAFGISAGVSLLIFPRSSRDDLKKTTVNCLREMRRILRKKTEYMHQVVQGTIPSDLNDQSEKDRASLGTLHARMRGHLGHAQNEIAWGGLSSTELEELTQLVEDAMTPLIGLCEAPALMKQENKSTAGPEQTVLRKESMAQHQRLLSCVIQPFSNALVAAETALASSEAIVHLHAAGQSYNRDSVKDLQAAMDSLIASKTDLVNAWKSQHGLLSDHSPLDEAIMQDERSSYNLHLLLCTELLLWSICRRVQQLVSWSVRVRSTERQARQRLILPGWTQLTRTVQQAFTRRSDRHDPRDGVTKRPHGRIQIFWVAFLRVYQASTQFFASPASGFAFRVTIATMSVAIAAYLPSSQGFYIKQHLVWAQYTVSYAMQASAGQSFRALVFRFGGTAVAVCLAWISWYIVVGIPAGVLAFYFISLHFSSYIMVLKPRYFSVGTVSAFALTSVLGNALQPDEPEQRTIVLGAIRLGAIGGGCLIATTWTFFPFPASDVEGARKSLAACCASLAEYHSNNHEVIRARLKQGISRENAAHLQTDYTSVRSRLFLECNSHLQTLRGQLKLLKWNVLTDGPPLSRMLYDQAANKIDDMIKNMQLMAFASESLIDFMNTQPPTKSNHASHWFGDFDALGCGATGVAALLSLLAYSIENGRPLPPTIRPLSPGQNLGQSARVLSQLDQPGTATFVMMRTGTKKLHKDLGELCLILEDTVGASGETGGFESEEPV